MRAGIKRWVWHGASLALAVGILAVLLGRQPWQHLPGSIEKVDGRLLAAAACLAAAYWAVRTGRWRWAAALEGQSIGWGRAAESMLAGLGVGLITPLRGGEVVRPMFLPRGARMRLAGWLVIEKMFDLSAVLTLCLIGLVYAIFATMLVVYFMVLAYGYFGAYPFAAILKVRESILVPVILVISFIGAYAVNSSLFDVGLALIFGFTGYLLNKFGFPLPPILMGIILGPIAEEGLRQSLMVSDGSWSILVTKPISAVFLGVTALIVMRKAYVLLFRKDVA